MGWYAKERAAERIARLAGQSLDLVTFWQESREALTAAVPHYFAPCWFTFDPASLLVTSHYDHDLIPELPPTSGSGTSTTRTTFTRWPMSLAHAWALDPA